MTDTKPASSSSNSLSHSEAELQAFGSVQRRPIALAHEARLLSCQELNTILADTMILYSHYKKYHWQMRGPTFYQLHLLLDKHADEQHDLIDTLAERVQTLGGVAVADPRHVAELTSIPRSPNGVEGVPALLSRLLESHEVIITKVRAAIEATARSGDGGTNDMLMSDVLRTHEFQVWFLAEQLEATPVVRSASAYNGADPLTQ